MHGTATVSLSRREREITLGVAAGRSNAEIARDLNLQVQTVKNGVSRILKKVQRSNRVQLAMWAVTELQPVGAAQAPSSAMAGAGASLVDPPNL